MEFLDFVPTSSSVRTLPQNVSRGVEPHQPHVGVCADERLCPTRSNEAAVRGLSNIRSASTSTNVIALSPGLSLGGGGRPYRDSSCDAQKSGDLQTHGEPPWASEAAQQPIARGSVHAFDYFQNGWP